VLNWIYHLPLWLLATLFISFFLGLTWVGMLVTRPRIHRWVGSDEDWNHVMGHVIASHGVLYGILLALLALGALENRTRLLDTVGREAASLKALYHDASVYPEPIRSDLMKHLSDYCDYVIEVAWPAQKRGIIPKEGVDRMNILQHRLMAFEPQTKGQEILFAETVRQFNLFIEARRQRIYAAEHKLPDPMWWVVGIGAILGIVLTLPLDIRRFSAHFIVAGSLALTTGLVVFLLVALDQPLRGGIHVTPEAFEIIRESMVTTELPPGAGHQDVGSRGAQ
jgi:hypothetical protein